MKYLTLLLLSVSTIYALDIGDRISYIRHGDTLYNNCKITDITNEEIEFMHRDGATKIILLVLDPAFLKKYLPKFDLEGALAKEKARLEHLEKMRRDSIEKWRQQSVLSKAINGIRYGGYKSRRIERQVDELILYKHFDTGFLAYYTTVYDANEGRKVFEDGQVKPHIFDMKTAKSLRFIFLHHNSNAQAGETVQDLIIRQSENYVSNGIWLSGERDKFKYHDETGTHYVEAYKIDIRRTNKEKTKLNE